jgi:hypothetical protein
MVNPRNRADSRMAKSGAAIGVAQRSTETNHRGSFRMVGRLSGLMLFHDPESGQSLSAKSQSN